MMQAVHTISASLAPVRAMARGGVMACALMVAAPASAALAAAPSCTADAGAAGHPQQAGLCAALTAAFAPLADRTLALRLIVIADQVVVVEVSDPATPGAAPVPFNWVVVDDTLAPHHYAQLASSIARSAQRAGLLRAN